MVEALYFDEIVYGYSLLDYQEIWCFARIKFYYLISKFDCH